MQLHNMQRPAIKKHKKRLGKGQGSGFGKQSGRGMNGQKSRSGASIPAWFEGGQMPLQRRVPKRGFTNIFKRDFRLVNLDDLETLELSEITIETLEKLHLIRKARKNEKAPVKILARGSDVFTKKIIIKANAFSKAAKEKIEKNGGIAEVI